MKLNEAAQIAQSYCGKLKVSHLAKREDGRILAIAGGYDGAVQRDDWCITNMGKIDGYYFDSTYGFSTFEAAKEHLMKEHAIVEFMEI